MSFLSGLTSLGSLSGGSGGSNATSTTGNIIQQDPFAAFPQYPFSGFPLDQTQLNTPTFGGVYGVSDASYMVSDDQRKKLLIIGAVLLGVYVIKKLK